MAKKKSKGSELSLKHWTQRQTPLKIQRSIQPSRLIVSSLGGWVGGHEGVLTWVQVPKQQKNVSEFKTPSKPQPATTQASYNHVSISQGDAKGLKCNGAKPASEIRQASRTAIFTHGQLCLLQHIFRTPFAIRWPFQCVKVVPTFLIRNV